MISEQQIIERRGTERQIEGNEMKAYLGKPCIHREPLSAFDSTKAESGQRRLSCHAWQSLILATMLVTSQTGCDELALPPSGSNSTQVSEGEAAEGAATDATATSPTKPGRRTPAQNAEILGPSPDPAAAAPGELVSAEVGVGKQGRGYGGGVITEPVRQYFRMQQQIVFDIAIPSALNTYKALDPNGKGPQTREAFLQLLAEHEIALPELPAGERYVWDPVKQELLVERPATPPAESP